MKRVLVGTSVVGLATLIGAAIISVNSEQKPTLRGVGASPPESDTTAELKSPEVVQKAAELRKAFEAAAVSQLKRPLLLHGSRLQDDPLVPAPLAESDEHLAANESLARVAEWFPSIRPQLERYRAAVAKQQEQVRSYAERLKQAGPEEQAPPELEAELARERERLLAAARKLGKEGVAVSEALEQASQIALD